MSDAAPATTPATTTETAAAVAAPAAAETSTTTTAAAEPAAADSSSSSSSSSSTAAEEAVEGADSTAEYQPLVQLKPVEVTTGEEQDEVLYKQRAACYRFDTESTSWKERGRGDVKILLNKENSVVRILLRQEKTLKLCMNHKILPELELVPNAGSDRSWTWRTIDFSTEEEEKQTFALRFKDAEIANQFKAKWDEAREINKKGKKADA